MTPDQELKLDSLLDSVGTIKANCKPCSEKVEAHETILNGPPENGKRPGLVTREATSAEIIKKMEKAQLVQAKWFRRQLGAAIAMLLAVAYAFIEHFMTRGPH